MDNRIENELKALLQVILDLRVPSEQDARFYIARPDEMVVLQTGWLQDLIEAIIREILLAFDLLPKSQDDDLEEIEDWKKAVWTQGWIERRRNHRLRIRTSVDSVFEDAFPTSGMTASVRAWKIQVMDVCADAIIERFHLRPAAGGTWACFRKRMQSIEKSLQQAINCKELFLSTGRVDEVWSMEKAIIRAQQEITLLKQEIENSDLWGRV